MKTQILLTLGWENIWRNKRRSIVTLLSISFGFAAAAIFAGYSHAVNEALANSAIHGELIGHIVVNREEADLGAKLHPNQYLMTASEASMVRAVAKRILPRSIVVEKLDAVGLLSNGKSSTIFIAVGIAPSDLDILRGPFSHGPGALHADVGDGVTIAQGLADILGLKDQYDASALSSTINGQPNAVDVRINETVNTGFVATNDKLMYMPIDLARSLMDAKGRSDSLTIIEPGVEPPNEKITSLLRARFKNELDNAGLRLQVRTWQEISSFYRQVKSIYDMIFLVMLCVVTVIVALSIANAMSMTVIERTREIGTLRAIGLRRQGVITLFVSEAALLIGMGILVGALLALLIRIGINFANISYIPPGSTNPVPMYIGIDYARTLVAAGVLAALALFAAYFPARKAAQNLIIESLAHV